ncbi:MAG: hypothetical protein D6795_18535 [Deltaproteobacteria bacterium]|nr:MAG: hypothetical protein D6795_18535 [Deltaproteobacteria bacterium]
MLSWIAEAETKRSRDDRSGEGFHRDKDEEGGAAEGGIPGRDRLDLEGSPFRGRGSQSGHVERTIPCLPDEKHRKNEDFVRTTSRREEIEGLHSGNRDV